MKLNILEKILVRMFRKTFEKVYKWGLTNAFNFSKTPSPALNNTIFMI